MATNGRAPASAGDGESREPVRISKRLEMGPVRRLSGSRPPRDRARRAYGHSRRASTVDAGIR